MFTPSIGICTPLRTFTALLPCHSAPLPDLYLPLLLEAIEPKGSNSICVVLPPTPQGQEV